MVPQNLPFTSDLMSRGGVSEKEQEVGGTIIMPDETIREQEGEKAHGKEEIKRKEKGKEKGKKKKGKEKGKEKKEKGKGKQPLSDQGKY